MKDVLEIEKLKFTNMEDLRKSNNDTLLQEIVRLKEYCQKLNQIIEAAPDGIYVTDGEANAIRINPAFERISGLKRKEMVGVNHHVLEKERIIQKSSSLMVVEQKKPVTIIHEYLATGRQALVTSIPVFDEKGELYLIVSGTRDLTELNDVKNKLAAERDCRMRYEKQIEAIKSQLLDTQDMVAEDSKTLDMLRMAKRVSSVDSTVLITGETGAGKEEIAKYIHKHSTRKEYPFLAVNCGAIPENLVESEFFGYEKGAFTGANQSGKIGILEAAEKGTVFLDEVGELPMEVQVKLLRALEDRAITRVGSTKRIPIDVRILSATNKNLLQMVREHKFREDLYYRLQVIPLQVPALSERRDDIIPLINFFLDKINQKYKLDKIFTPLAYRVLYHYNWPGNVRELKNVVERVAVMSDGEKITAQDLPMYQETIWEAGPQNSTYSLKDRLEQIEYTCIMEALTNHKSIRKAAASIQMTVPTFIRKRDQYAKKYRSKNESPAPKTEH